ncbi:hypothetical protein AAKU61_004479 [Undibacterium sp. GrIS 1.2]
MHAVRYSIAFIKLKINGLSVKQRREFSTSIEIQRPGNFRRSNGRKGSCESLWKRPTLTTGKFTTPFDNLTFMFIIDLMLGKLRASIYVALFS